MAIGLEQLLMCLVMAHSGLSLFMNVAKIICSSSALTLLIDIFCRPYVYTDADDQAHAFSVLHSGRQTDLGYGTLITMAKAWSHQHTSNTPVRCITPAICLMSMRLVIATGGHVVTAVSCPVIAGLMRRIRPPLIVPASCALLHPATDTVH